MEVESKTALRTDDTRYARGCLRRHGGDAADSAYTAEPRFLEGET